MLELRLAAGALEGKLCHTLIVTSHPEATVLPQGLEQMMTDEDPLTACCAMAPASPWAWRQCWASAFWSVPVTSLPTAASVWNQLLLPRDFFPQGCPAPRRVTRKSMTTVGSLGLRACWSEGSARAVAAGWCGCSPFAIRDGSTLPPENKSSARAHLRPQALKSPCGQHSPTSTSSASLWEGGKV